MVTSEKIEIRELYEFQLFELGALGEAVPVGEPRRSLEPTVSFDDEHHGIRSDQLYALRRRRIKIDDTGIAEYGAWSRLTPWKRPNTSEVD